MPKQVIVAYVPVLHRGYRRLFDKYPGQVLVLGPEILTTFDDLRKDLRALTPQQAVDGLKGWGIDARLAEANHLAELASDVEIIMPDEDVAHLLSVTYFTDHKVILDPIFLRWDRRRVQGKVDPLDPDRTISAVDLDIEMIGRAVAASRKSSNFYRRVGAVLVKDGEVIMEAANQYEASPYANWTDGDPRNSANRGVSIDITTDMHAEVRIIAEAAKRGIALEGASLYITTFPCPVCAKLVARSGISKVYYAEGYAMLDGHEVLKANGVELIHVEGIDTDDPNPDIWLPYPEKKK
jgi:dCMP deaminase